MLLFPPHFAASSPPPFLGSQVQCELPELPANRTWALISIECNTESLCIRMFGLALFIPYIFPSPSFSCLFAQTPNSGKGMGKFLATFRDEELEAWGLGMYRAIRQIGLGIGDLESRPISIMCHLSSRKLLWGLCLSLSPPPGAKRQL